MRRDDLRTRRFAAGAEQSPLKLPFLNRPVRENRRAFPLVEILFLMTIGFAAAAFYTRMTAYWMWKRDEPTGKLGMISWLWTVAAFGPFLMLVTVAPNPELSEAVPPRARRRQILMFLSIGIMFVLEAFLLTF
jgi:hypothetical protein